jgi:hypothetical protein
MANSGIKVESGDLIVNEHDEAASSTVGLYLDGTKVVGTQEAFIADPSGGATQDAEARSAIADILDLLIAHGLMASS